MAEEKIPEIPAKIKKVTATVSKPPENQQNVDNAILNAEAPVQYQAEVPHQNKARLEYNFDLLDILNDLGDENDQQIIPYVVFALREQNLA